MGDAPKGICFAMCSEKERLLRERENLLNTLEADDKTKHSKYKKADPSKTVKSYKRSSAGSTTAELSELRPGPVLVLTVRYLLNRVIFRKDVSWTVIYEFVFDRLRAVRQDMIIQRLDAAMCIRLLVPIVKFHVYASERMRDKSLAEYVPKFNNQHLLECIKQLLVLYDQTDNDANIDDNRVQIEAMYLLLYLGDTTALKRGLSLPLKYRELSTVKIALNLSKSWYTQNYVRVCRDMSKLSSLLAIAAFNNLPNIRSVALQIMSVAYRSKALTYPGEKLQSILLYKDVTNVAKDCSASNLTFIDGNIHFEKLPRSIHTMESENHFSDRELDELLTEIIT